jgi:hypothetical protein
VNDSSIPFRDDINRSVCRACSGELEKGERELRPNTMETRGAIYLWSFMLSGVHGAEHTSGRDIGDGMPPPSLARGRRDPFDGSGCGPPRNRGVWMTPVAVFSTFDYSTKWPAYQPRVPRRRRGFTATNAVSAHEELLKRLKLLKLLSLPRVRRLPIGSTGGRRSKTRQDRSRPGKLHNTLPIPHTVVLSVRPRC